MTGRRLRRLDIGGPQLADYEIIDRDDRRVGLLEVTTSTQSERLSFDASLARFDWRFHRLRRSWWIHVGVHGPLLDATGRKTFGHLHVARLSPLVSSSQ